jgi:hypothetical protein
MIKNNHLPEDTSIINVTCKGHNVIFVAAVSKNENVIYKFDGDGIGYIADIKKDISVGCYIDDDGQVIVGDVINFRFYNDICFTSKNLKQND